MDSLSSFNKRANRDQIAPDITTEEQEIINGLQSGDPRAIEKLYLSYFERLYSFIFHSVKRDQSIAEDIIQETFLGAIKSAKQFKGKSKLYTWLAGIAHHKIYDYYRSQARKLNLNNSLIIDTIVPSQTVSDISRELADGLESTELRLTVRQALSNLPFDYQQVLLLKYVENMSIIEISQVMNRSPKAIDGLLTRARKMLRKRLPEKIV